jgi:shikimate dehydrogenase
MERYYLLGESVSDSLSPVMMDSAFGSLGIDAVYSALSVKRSEFRRRFLSLSRESSGMNITIPFKSEVIPLLDDLDPVSKKIGAVNVTKTSGGRCVGFNTDVPGIVVPLRERVGNSEIGSSLLVGAGGAARAFCEAMSQVGCGRVTVVVRDLVKGRRFVEETSLAFPEIEFDAQTIDGLSGRRARTAGTAFGLIFNATPMGSGGIPLAEGMKRVIYGTEIVFDAVYRPMETELLKFAKEKGCRVIYGYEMLLNQGASAFEKWTGVRAPGEIMRRALLGCLEVRN